MGKGRYVFDEDTMRFGKDRKNRSAILFICLKYLICSISLAVLYYIIFAIFFSTDTERMLRNENRIMEKMYPELQSESRLLDEVVSGLKARDEMIYRKIFEASPPDFDKFSDAGLVSASSDNMESMIDITEIRADFLLDKAGDVDGNFRRIIAALSSDTSSIPPMNIPLDSFAVSMTGASVGKKMNPFYKVAGQHSGLDFMSPLGNPVIAAAEGVVSDVERLKKGGGNIVTLLHSGGYRTKYAHLQNVAVRRGEKVSKGDVVGYVGMTGVSFAPHLHFEIWKDSVAVDPVDYLFADLTPDEYVEMSVMASVTGQSLD